MRDPFTGPEVAALTGVPYVTLAKYVGQGVVAPSLHKGEGSGTVSQWSFVDLVAIASLGALRPSPASLGTLRSLFDEWHRPKAHELVAAAVASAAGRRDPPRAFVVVADDGRVALENETNLAVISQKYGPRLFVVDAAKLVEVMLVEATVRRMTPEMAKKTSTRSTSRPRKKKARYPALLREARERYGEKKSGRKT